MSICCRLLAASVDKNLNNRTTMAAGKNPEIKFSFSPFFPLIRPFKTVKTGEDCLRQTVIHVCIYIYIHT